MSFKMASLCRIASRLAVVQKSTFSRIPAPLCARFASSDLLRPGPYPKTQAEREAAAKKYNMRIEDYEPYPDDGMGWGDYPKLKPIHNEDRDPHADWDFIQERRNWGDTLHIEEDSLLPQRANYLKRHPKSMKYMVTALGGVLTVLGLLFYLGHKFKNFRPVMPKQYPYNNLWLENGGDPEKMPEVKHYEI